MRPSTSDLRVRFTDAVLTADGKFVPEGPAASLVGTLSFQQLVVFRGASLPSKMLVFVLTNLAKPHEPDRVFGLLDHHGVRPP